jgi:hypothetical protein
MWLWSYVKSIPNNNFGVVVPDRIFRAAQPSLIDLKNYIEKYKIEVVLNLREGDRSNERADAESLDLIFEHVPMADNAAPTDEQITQALVVLRSGMVVLFGCKGNRHRGSVVASVYAVVDQKKSKEQAWREQAEAYGYYSALGHKPIKDWFLSTDLRRFK